MTDIMDTSPSAGTGDGSTNDDNTTQVTSTKTFTQEELNAIVAKRIAQEQKKYEGLDLEEYQTLKSAKQQAEEAEALKRQEFDKVLKQTKERYDSELGTLRSELQKVKIDGSLRDAATRLKTANPEHVSALLRNSVKLDETGNVVVVDSDGNVRYNTESAEPFTIDDLVNEFVNQNPYFRAPTRKGTGAEGNSADTEFKPFDVSQLDLTKKEDREKYAQLRKDGKIRI